MAGDTGPAQEFSLFVGDLAHEADDAYLIQFFSQFFPSVRSAKVMTDAITGRSRGYGFVRFGSEAERDRALHELQGAVLHNRPVRVSIATAKRVPDPPSGGGGMVPHAAPTNIPPAVLARLGPTGPPSAEPSPADWDPTNTTLFIGGLAPSLTEEQLRAAFSRFGTIIYTKIPPGKGCGFVQFVDRRAAEWAMLELQGHPLGGSPMRISWGRSTGAKGGGATPGPVPYPPPVYPAYGAVYAPAYDPYGHPTTTPGFTVAAYPDPYGYAAVHPGMDPYGYAYGGVAIGGYPSAGGSTSASSSMGGAPTPTLVYDPMAPVQVDKINALYMQRRMPLLNGAFMRPVHM